MNWIRETDSDLMNMLYYVQTTTKPYGIRLNGHVLLLLAFWEHPLRNPCV